MSDSKKDNPYVTTATCKLVTDALKDNIAAQKTLVDAEIKGVVDKFYVAAATLGVVLTIVEVALKFWKA